MATAKHKRPKEPRGSCENGTYGVVSNKASDWSLMWWNSTGFRRFKTLKDAEQYARRRVEHEHDKTLVVRVLSQYTGTCAITGTTVAEDC